MTITLVGIDLANLYATEQKEQNIHSFPNDRQKCLSDFSTKAQQYQHKYGVKKLTIGTMNPIMCICDERDNPFAVIKEGKRIPKEAFISNYARIMGISDVFANSILVDNQILIEEYVSYGEHEKLQTFPGELKEFIVDNQEFNAFPSFYLFRRFQKEIVSKFVKYLDPNSTHKLFLAVLNMFAEDSGYRNINIKHDGLGKLNLIAYDLSTRHFCLKG